MLPTNENEQFVSAPCLDLEKCIADDCVVADTHFRSQFIPFIAYNFLYK